MGNLRHADTRTKPNFSPLLLNLTTSLDFTDIRVAAYGSGSKLVAGPSLGLLLLLDAIILCHLFLILLSAFLRSARYGSYFQKTKKGKKRSFLRHSV
mmetsp:Transcript_21960/g.33528  ORF Transcript_21960/g.33528 Transcript_21960/m.33528 type:complete len:97 (+) Transcript_21960:1200-1490(+)